MKDSTIVLNNLQRTYQTYSRPEGVTQSIKGLFKRKTVEKIALYPTTLKILPGEIVGLVGANGAGKTTLIKLLSGLIHPTSGEASVMGFSPWERDNAFLQQIGILLGQKNQLWWDLPAMDSFLLLMKIYGLEEKKAKDWVYHLAKRLQCDHVMNTQLRRLSLGERMKMEIIGAILHRPKILFLDEPTIGLDIVAQKSIREFLHQLSNEYHPTIILTSHYMDDIASLSTRLLLMSQGRLAYDGTVKDFSKKARPTKRITLTFEKKIKEEKYHFQYGEIIESKELLLVADVLQEKLGAFFQEVTQLGSLSNIQLEEENFEDVIHQFLEGSHK